MSDGWMTTKKVGRDDKAIAAAQQKAANAQRAKRGLKPLAAKKKQPPKKRAAAKNSQPKRKRKDAWSESEESEEEFEEEEEESEEEEEFDVSEEEEEEEEDDDDLVLDSDDESDGPSFLTKSKKKNVKVKPMLAQAAKLKAKNKKKGFAASLAPSLKIKTVSRSSTSSSDEGDDDDDDVDVDDYLVKDNGPPKRAAAANKPIVDFNSDLSEEDNGAPSNFKKKSALPNAVQSKYFQSQSNAINPVSEDPFASDSDTPMKPKSNAAVAGGGGGRKRAIQLDDDDEDFTPVKAAATHENPYNVDDDGDDFHDEDMAAAIKASIKTDSQKTGGRLKKLGKNKGKSSNKQNAQKKRKKDKDDEDDSSLKDGFLLDSDEEPEEVIDIEEEPEVVYKEDEASSSEDENGLEGDEEDEYMDAEAQEASSVLATANDLSASVLRIMASWASDGAAGDENGNGDGKMIVPQGMIVDGAISLSKVAASRRSGTNNNKHQHSWISAEVMKNIMPKEITLKEYQLLGVNWLAMLHSMTCKVATDKKPTNVNGVLADEMGLGKTCQTIAFMAWLKYSRGKGLLEEAGSSALPKKDKNESDYDESDDEVDVIEEDSKPVPKKKPSKKLANVSMRQNDEESSPSRRLPHLVVVPASVVSNWEREFATFAPDMHIMKYHGSMEERLELQRTLRPYLPKHRDLSYPMIDVILTSITYFQKETSDDRDFLRRFQFDYMVIDEGHLLKNAKGLRYRNLNRFKTRHRLLLTGTPVQNSPQELMALLCFLMPLFSQKSGEYGNEGESDGGEGMLQHFVQLEGNRVANTGENSQEFAYRKLKQLFAPFVLRRRKLEVLSEILPEKKYQVELVDLGKDARRHYDAIVEEHVTAKRNKTKSATDSLFTQLRKASHHPLLLRTRHTSPAEVDHLAHWFFRSGAFRGEASSKERVARELEKYNDFEIHLTAHELLDENPNRKELERYILTEEDLFQSAKMVRLREILPEIISDGHRILIFSVWTSCLDLLGVMLDNMGIRFMRMDGQTNVAERQGLIDDFNKDVSIPIFLLSTTACGMGINLTSADVCIMHDINMNPFSDLQAEDRCHRIGQQKPVTVIKMIAKDCVDSAIYEMQERKMKMNAAIMDVPSEWAKEEKKAKNEMVKNAVDRYLSSPKAKNNKSAAPEKENVEKNQEVIDVEECNI